MGSGWVRPVLRSRGFDNLTQDRSIPMTEQAISPVRRRLIEDMSIRKFAAKTQHDYVQRVKDFATLLGRPPGTAEAEDVRRFRLHLTWKRSPRPASENLHIRNFFGNGPKLSQSKQP